MLCLSPRLSLSLSLSTLFSLFIVICDKHRRLYDEIWIFCRKFPLRLDSDSTINVLTMKGKSGYFKSLFNISWSFAMIFFIMNQYYIKYKTLNKFHSCMLHKGLFLMHIIHSCAFTFLYLVAQIMSSACLKIRMNVIGWRNWVNRGFKDMNYCLCWTMKILDYGVFKKQFHVILQYYHQNCVEKFVK